MRVNPGEICPFGKGCKHAVHGKYLYGKWGMHTEVEKKHHQLKQKLAEAEKRGACAFCVQGCCRFGESCRRGVQSDRDYDGSEGENDTDVCEKEVEVNINELERSRVARPKHAGHGASTEFIFRRPLPGRAGQMLGRIRPS